MGTTNTRQEDYTTDAQFKALMAMLLEILENNSIEDAKKIIARLAGDITIKDTLLPRS